MILYYILIWIPVYLFIGYIISDVTNDIDNEINNTKVLLLWPVFLILVVLGISFDFLFNIVLKKVFNFFKTNKK